jgi:uncharacterized protein with HEPN domain
MKKDAGIFLAHILESIELIEGFLKDVSREKFLESIQLQDAVVRRLEIIGEAAKNIPKSFMAKYPEIPWRKITGTRDIIVHEYFGVDLKLTFKIAKDDLPELKEKILKISKEISSGRIPLL